MTNAEKLRAYHARNKASGWCIYHKNRLPFKGGMCLSCYYSMMEKQQVKRKRPGSYTPYPRKDSWGTVDWSKTNQQIANEMKVSARAVLFQRQKRKKI